MVPMLTGVPAALTTGFGVVTEARKAQDDGSATRWGRPEPGWGGNGSPGEGWESWEGWNGWEDQGEDSSAAPRFWSDPHWPGAGPALPGAPWFGYGEPKRSDH